jgi:hypothetical protein
MTRGEEMKQDSIELCEKIDIKNQLEKEARAGPNFEYV